jgi:ABC-type Fe3+/spermidine/putrescine transport system ATPase subunit
VKSGVTTLFVTHDQGEALAVADKVVVLRDGQVEQIGTPDELWNFLPIHL